MPKTSKVIQDPNLIVFINQIVEAVKDGWELDESNPPGLYGFYYEVHALKDENLIEPPRPSRAEILANARAAKSAKKADTTSVTDTEQAPPSDSQDDSSESAQAAEQDDAQTA